MIKTYFSCSNFLFCSYCFYKSLEVCKKKETKQISAVLLRHCIQKMKVFTVDEFLSLENKRG